MNGATDDDLITRAAALNTSSLSDAMDRLGIPGQVQGIRPISPGYVLCGPAFTVRYRPVVEVGETVGDYIDDVPPGSVVAIDNRGRTDCTVWGDILTETGSSRGVAGTVIHGVSRDSVASISVRYPIFSSGTWMRTGKDRVTVDAVNVPINLGGVAVAPGDVIFGDDDGAVVIPRPSLAAVVALAESIDATEEQIRAAVRSGERLDHARAAFNYHSLQRAVGNNAPAGGGVD